MQFIHDPWFVSLYPIMIFGLAFVLGRLTARTPSDIRDREYTAGWKAGQDAALLRTRELIQEVLAELSEPDVPNVLINRRTPAFFKRQAD